MVDKRLNEIRYDAEHWLDPRNINVGNETWLCAEICKKNGVSNSAGQIGPTLIWGDMMVCRTSFVFHYQGQTTRWCHGKKHSPTSLRPENTRENLWRNA